MKRRCIVCNKDFKIEMMSRHRRTMCIDCYRDWHREYQHKWRNTDAGRKIQQAVYRRWADKNRDKLYESRKAYRRKNKKKIREYHRKYYRTYRKQPEEMVKDAARRMLAAGIAMGWVKREPCERCGHVKSQGHHPDYSKPLVVTWLCAKHHKQYHAEFSTAGVASYTL
jgi:hypothetical protein